MHDLLHPSTALHIDLQARPSSAHKAREALWDFMGDLRVAEERAADIIMAVGEAVSNAIEHAYQKTVGAFHLTAQAQEKPTGTELHVHIKDEGTWRPAHGLPNRGHGMIIMNSIAKDLQVHTSEDGTDVGLVFAIHEPQDLFVAQKTEAA